ncbi:pilus assembly protein TadG-related protein [Methylobacterium nonmethylotrophicum]|uniref:Putative Flp pilus-assembly TadG-like N-terminal domain-containing protein n=1 Tax=Methylobacterium nonmethylotrophicum TaxID=1141884 RepID=A0A4Z0NXC3_9HYPH|nr:pilus assembly protein TadG-related protein [Methylobacterium nonmethylotrophicum]TGE01929.1 hypothetical protein EU555_04480 [Methylobacterium nonmethylotrophicum]
MIAFWSNRSGAGAVMAAPLLFIAAAVAGLVIDVGFAYRENNRLLTIAEAAALAAATFIDSTDRASALTAAQDLALRNAPLSKSLINRDDLVFGHWENGRFTEVGSINAVRATASMTPTKGNAFRTAFAKMFGSDHWSLSRSSVAMLGSQPLCILVLHPTHSDALDIDPGA